MINNENVYNPWEDNKSFIQDTGDLGSFINYLNNNKIYSSSNQDYLGVIDDKNNEIYSNLNLLKNLNKSSKIHFEKLTILEELYEKYRYETILSKQKNDELCQSIYDLMEILNKIESNKIKIANLLHNTHISDSNTIKIKHFKKFDFLKIMKLIVKQNKTNYTDFDYINFSSSIHPETINQIINKYELMFDKTEIFIKQYEDINKLVLN